jgi:hypothetical protein
MATSGEAGGWVAGSAGTPWGAVASREAQPTCVRAFFLRFASLRFRFTLGFS